MQFRNVKIIGKISMELIRHELEYWQRDVEDLGRAGIQIGENTKDPQRQKLSYYIVREVLGQSREIYSMGIQVCESMQKLEDFLDSEMRNEEKVKKYPR
jgi:hypothetical protein